MKHTLLICVSILSTFSIGARQLSADEALSRALTDRNLPSRVHAKAKKATDKPVMTIAERNGMGDVYVFNTDGGYLVLPGNDIAAPVLGYSESGALQSDNLPPALGYWLAEYARQIQYAETNGAAAYIQQQSDERTPIEPMVKTSWNQDAPYNNLTPTYGGEHAVTGCVATALAQVMKYYNYPPKVTGTRTYTSNGVSVSFDYGNTTFEWDKMLDSYTSSATADEQKAVAELMLACGVSVEMSYSTDESGAASVYVPSGMVNYFGYDKGVRYIPRDYYTMDDWNEMVYNNLRDYGPMQYSGQSSDGGHSFVCDGYSHDGYFHINWGWGGMSDGYFLLSALTPASQGIGGSSSGYNYNQDIIACVKPGDNGISTGTVYEELYNQDGMAVSSETVTLGNQVSFGSGFANYSTAAISGTMAIKLVASDGTVSYIEGPQFNSLPSLNMISSFSVTLPTTLAAGTYTISPAFMTSSGEMRDIPVKMSGIRTLKMTVADNTATFAAGTVASITVPEYNSATPFYIGSYYNINATVENTSDGEYYGAIILGLINSDGQLVAEGATYPVDITAGESVQIQYSSTFSATSGNTLSAGQYYICFINADGQQISEMTQITLNAATETTVSATTPLIENASAVVASDFKVTADVSCTKGYFGGSLTLVIFPYSDTGGSVSSVAAYGTDALFIAEGSKSTVTINKPFDNAEAGKRYFCALYNGQSAISNYGYFTVSSTSGVEDISADADMTAEYYTLTGQKVTTEKPAPGLYIQIKGGQAEKVLIR